MNTIPANIAFDIRKWLLNNPDQHQQANDLFNLKLTARQLNSLVNGNFIFDMPVFSFYRKPVRNKIPLRNINIAQVYKAITSDYYADVTGKLRSISDSKQARDFKTNYFDHVTFSGTFSERKTLSLTNRSFYSVFDFDHVPDTEKIKSILINDQHICPDLVFTSPSGDGVKAIIYDQDKADHETFYKLVTDYIRIKYPDIFHFLDEVTKDISRTCFLCCDPQAYINPNILELWQAQRN